MGAPILCIFLILGLALGQAKAQDYGEPKNIPSLPANFDSRQQWPDCVDVMKPQGACNASWAFVASSVFADRYCIHHGQYIKFSPGYLLSCDLTNKGCQSGDSELAWRFLKQRGIVSWLAFPVLPVEDTVESCPPVIGRLSGDVKERIHASQYYRVRPSVTSIETEIISHGPVQARMALYPEFLEYKTGIFGHVSDVPIDEIYVKLIGWGERYGVKYWIAQAPLGEEWGQRGYFHIAKGENICGIEEYVMAGTPE